MDAYSDREWMKQNAGDVGLVNGGGMEGWYVGRDTCECGFKEAEEDDGLNGW